MRNEVFYLSDDKRVSLTAYLYEKSPVLWNLKDEWEPARRPAVIVCPGGAYSFLADREGEPVALSFFQQGFDAFVLRYSLGDDSAFPGPLEEISRAVWLIRSHAGQWRIDPDQITVCGFSAGGHLCTMLGTQWNTPGLCERLGIPEGGNKPNAMVLCYATTGEYSGGGKDDTRATKTKGKVACGFGAMMAPPLVPQAVTINYVTDQTAPAFIWQAREDFLNVKENMHFAEKLYDCGVPYELHIFGNGSHGLSLCQPQTSYYFHDYPANVKEWFPLCVGWLKSLYNF